MFGAIQRNSAIALALAASVAFASSAQAGGYPGNGCVAKKQGAVGKYTKSVGKAWTKYPSDATARNAAIAAAFTKLDDAWTKNEAKAVLKGATCNESTDTSTAVAAIVDAAVAGVVAENFSAVTDYTAAVMKAYGKYIKAPGKDPGKTKLSAAISAASTSYLSTENVAVNTAAATLQDDLVEATTTAPNYPTTFQTIVPGTTVQYGKETLSPTCIDGGGYQFFARKGTNNKVLMYYQGGGACWDKTSCFGVPGGTCSRTADASDNPALTTTGFGDYSNPANPFHDWNVVFVTYCSCDVHWGENAEVYDVGQIGRHFGRVNAKVAEKFAREHFVDPDEVFATGSSAGSYGAIMNSYWLMRDVWPNAQYGVLGDAGVGIITQGFLDDYIEHWGVSKNFPTDLPGVALPVTNLSLVDLIDGLAQRWPSNRFANYDSSYDGGSGSQTQFFQVMRHPSPPGSFITDWPTYWESTCEWNACMRAFKEENSTRATNYKFFTGAGSRHTMFGSDKVYTETKSTREDNNAPMTIAAWVTAMIAGNSDWVNVDCNNPGGDCNLTNSCQGGSNAGGLCTSNVDCPGGSCQNDPDTANAPYNNDDTVTCPVTTCPCGPAAAKCVGGANDGLVCTVDGDCPSGSCVWVRCPTFTP